MSDKLTEIVIYFMIIFSPWAFGSTESWSIWTMNYSAFALGLLLIIKTITRLFTRYEPWEKKRKNTLNLKQKRLNLINKICNITLLLSMFLLLAYILTSAINARASFNLQSHEYTFFEGFNKALPHSYDAQATWSVFWQYLGLIIVFWAIRDWAKGALKDPQILNSINPRIKQLIFLFCINGGVLALLSIIQRSYYDGQNGRLLFLIEPTMNISSNTHFGPFAYRSNAASFLNLVWPICLGLFMSLSHENLGQRKKRFGNGPEMILIPILILCLIGTIISTSRGGSLVMLGLLAITTILIIFKKSSTKSIRFTLIFSLFLGLTGSIYFGWDALESRLMNIFTDKMSNRTYIYEVTNKMISEYPIFGSGPGSFETVAQFELGGTFPFWESWAHNDYLEFILTFGKYGTLIIILLAAVISLQAIIGIFFTNNRNLLIYGLVALIGISIHAFRDFPLQVHSILFSIVLITAIISTSSNEDHYKVYLTKK